MRYNHKILIFICFAVLMTQGCAVKWTEAIKYGSISSVSDKENTHIEIQEKLIIVPVTIGKNEYRFLFDTGAPFSISEKLQKKNNFKVVSKGTIVDSDYNKKKVSWVQVDSASIANVLFCNQTAFVGDFDANPIMKCLGIDGIVGSNLIRQCDWTIDQEKHSLTLSNNGEKNSVKGSMVIPFKTDYQYNIYIDIHIGQSKIKNILVDYGSNGSIALSDQIVTVLEEKNIINDFYVEKGTNQSGIVGKPVELNRKISYSDSVRIHNLNMKNVMIRTGKTVSIGNDFLSRFKVTIDWKNKNLYLMKYEKVAEKSSTAGFTIGYTSEKGFYIQSVIETSDAYSKGVRPNMKVVKINRINFENKSDFCEYMDLKLDDKTILELVNSKGQTLKYQIEKTFL